MERRIDYIDAEFYQVMDMLRSKGIAKSEREELMEKFDNVIQKLYELANR